MMDGATREAIERAAVEHGIDPTIALAIAERESNFNPRARSSKTIRGIFQMTGDLRNQYGVGNSDDPYAQAKGWGAFFRDNKREMARVLGRDPTDAEGYLGHHFGGVRAARMMKMDPATPVSDVFTSNERRLNPHFDKAGTVGNLNDTVLADIGKRQAKLGGVSTDMDFAGEGIPTGAPDTASAPDFSHLSVLADTPVLSAPAASSAPDFSNFSVPA